MYEMQSKSIISRPSIHRGEIDEIIREAHLNDKFENEIFSKAMAVKGVVDLQALYAGSAQHASGGGAGSGRGGGQTRSGRFKSGQQQQQEQQQQQHGGGRVELR